MFLYYFPIGMTVVSNALYHVVQKLMPASVNPLLALTMRVVGMLAVRACID